MRRSNKVALAIAIGAIAVFVAAGLARCALAPGSESGTAGQGDRQETPQAEDASGELSSAEPSLSHYSNTAWVSGEGAVLTVIDGAFVETLGEETAVTYWTQKSSSRSESSETYVVSLVGGDGEPSGECLVAISSSERGATSISCDAFSLAGGYVLEAPEFEGVVLANPSGDLFDALGIGQAEIEAAISAWAEASSPHASTATWGMEVYTDFGGGTTLTSFTLDDPAGTAVSLVVSHATGEVEVM